MSIFYILVIFFAALTRILFSLEQTVIVNIIGQITVGCMYSMNASILINVMMRSWVRFRDSIYKDESYLTHTLPVTKNDIYNSKFLQTLIFFIISFFVVILSLFITYYTQERWIMLKDVINSITAGLNMDTGLFITAFILIIFLEIFNAIQCGFFGIILGHKQNNNKIGFSVLFGFVAYLITQNIILALTFISGLFNNNIMELFKSNVALNAESLKLLIWLSIIFYILIIIVMNILCKRIFRSGVDVE